MSDTKKKPDTKKKGGDKDEKDEEKGGFTDARGDLDDFGLGDFPSLISGDGLLKMLENVIPLLGSMGHAKKALDIEDGDDEEISSAHELGDNPFDVISDSDLDDEDPVVKEFKSNDGGVKGVVRIIRINRPNAIEQIASIIDRLQSIRIAHRTQVLRETFAAIHRAKAGKGAIHQTQAVEAIERLAATTLNPAERIALLKASDAALAGSDEMLDTAAFRVRNVFASYVPVPNVRVAYTTLNTQEGEPFLLCPKAKDQIGTAQPIEASKCRDNCVDCRLTRDGKVACAYRDWLKVAADNNLSVQARFETIRHPDNNTINLGKTRDADGTIIHESNVKGDKRSIAAHDVEDHNNFETRMNALKDRDKKPAEDGREKQLDEVKLYGHQGEEKAEKNRPETVFEKKSSRGWNLAREIRLSADVAGDSPYPKGHARIDADEDDPLGVQVEKGNKPTDVEPTEERLDKEGGLYGWQGTAKMRSQDLHGKAPNGRRQAGWKGDKVVKIDPSKDENVEEQMDAVHSKEEPSDDTREILLDDTRGGGLTDKELDMLLEEWLSDDRGRKE